MVAALSEVTGGFSSIRDKMLLNKTGRRILRSQPLVSTSSIDLTSLAKLPENTFGYQYLKFLETNSVSPDSRVPVRYIADEQIAYVCMRYRQCHDFWHVLLGLNTSVTQELALKWFEMAHFGLPVNYLSSFVGPLALDSFKELEGYLVWALRAGSNSKFLMNVYYEELFPQDIHQLRERLSIEQLHSL